jgi:hypothetical protein
MIEKIVKFRTDNCKAVTNMFCLPYDAICIKKINGNLITAEHLNIGDDLGHFGIIVHLEKIIEGKIDCLDMNINVPIDVQNDCICSICKNNRCSKSEINCWWCGGKL